MHRKSPLVRPVQGMRQLRSISALIRNFRTKMHLGGGCVHTSAANIRILTRGCLIPFNNTHNHRAQHNDRHFCYQYVRCTSTRCYFFIPSISRNLRRLNRV